MIILATIILVICLILSIVLTPIATFAITMCPQEHLQLLVFAVIFGVSIVFVVIPAYEFSGLIFNGVVL